MSIVKNNNNNANITNTTNDSSDAIINKKDMINDTVEIDEIQVLNVDINGAFDSDNVNNDCNEPLKPSEIIRNAVKAGEIKLNDIQEKKDTIDNEEVMKVDEIDGNNNDIDSSDDDNDNNEDEDYDGPYIITTTSISSNDTKGIRILDVDEYDIKHKFHHLECIPLSLTFKEPIIKAK